MRRAAILTTCGLLALSTLLSAAAGPPPSREEFLTMARKGWVFEFRSSLFRRDPGLPPVRFDGRSISTGPVCVFGEAPRVSSRAVFAAYDALLAGTFGRTEAIRYAGPEITDCPARQRVYVRLYSGHAPSGAFNADLRRLNRDFGIGLPTDRPQRVTSPAQAAGYFGRRGDVAHVLVRQPDAAPPTALQEDFYTSILVEEMFQVFTYGVDILKFDPETPFISKLQELPTYLKHLPWESEGYMKGLLASNPKGLCAFDVFMLHALASSGLESSNSPVFLDFIAARFDELAKAAAETLADARLRVILDPACAALPERGRRAEADGN